MIKFYSAIFFLSIFSFQLNAQTVDALDEKNGFQDIKMTSSISNYEGLELKKDIDDPTYPEAKLYVPKKGFYEKIGSLKIHDLQVKTYKDAIYEIRIIMDKDPNLYKGLKEAFGQPEFSYRAGKSRWVGKNLQLSYDDHSRNKMEMVYTSFVMIQKLRDDKKDEVKDIADDF